MQIVIDIDENDYDLIKEYGIITFPTVGKAIANGTPIPDNATNGDVIKAIFPTGYERAHEPIMDFVVDGYCYMFDYDWWNAPYQKGGKEESFGGELYEGEFENR